MDHLMCSMCNYTTNEQKKLTYHIVRHHRNDSTLHVLSLDVFIVQSLGQGLKLTFHGNIGKKLMQQYLEVPTQDAGDEYHPAVIHKIQLICIVLILH